MRQIRIFDTTLRDGEQSPGVALSLDQKLEIAHALARLNVDIIEAGFPVSGPAEFEAVQRIATEVKGPIIAALARTATLDIDQAAKALEKAEKPRIHVFTSASKVHLQYMLRKTEEEVLEMADRMVRYARRYVDDVEFSAQDVMRADWEFVKKLYEVAIEAGATTVNIPDTTGYGIPSEYGALIRRIRDEVVRGREVIISTHTHDDLGLATANALAGIENGAGQVECTINGIGERAGNTALEEVVMALYVRKDHYQAYTQVNTRELYRVSRLVERYTGMPVPPNKAIVGDNAFAHESGIHQDGVIKHRATYEIMDAELIGRRPAVLVLGKHSGRAAFKKALEDLGYAFSEERLNQLFRRFKEIAERKGPVSSEELVALVESEEPAVHFFELVHIQFVSGSGLLPTATVKVRTPQGEKVATATGSGPVDAVYKAIQEVIGFRPELETYRVEAITGSTEALGQVTVRLRHGELQAVGVGVSPDIVEASALAFLDAAGRLASGRATRHPPTLEQVQKELG
ncbi:MAG: 2-isopropylmalate synthase [Thermaceae bacterium]